MYKVDLKNKKLIKLSTISFSELDIKERFDIEEWIEKTPNILGEDLLVIGKEMILPSGKRLDLLCVDKEANLVVIELKRDDSGSEVEWQAIKYTSYCSSFTPEEIYQYYAIYIQSSELDAQKKIEEFISSDIEKLNNKQRIVLVSKEFNSDVISAVLWLREYSIDIQCTRITPYLDGNNELFLKPEIIIPLPEAKDYIKKKEIKRIKSESQAEWTGYWFINVGEGPHRTWKDNISFGYLSAGQGKWYSDALKRLSIGDKVYAYMKGYGYVGFGEVIKEATPIKDFFVESQNQYLLDLKLTSVRADENKDNPDLSEWVVGIKWFKNYDKDQAKTFPGVFANQNVVCKLTHKPTLIFVKEYFGE
jgi:hypothetical protein